ncbi:hypothetical protein B0H13DRAFT_2394099 [Mycena leptocephala]|nr:hypothetical protein B0H13DRAFT_2394099 [Mycena leptocephala]
MHVQQASSILLVCCTQFELILQPCSDRASNDASISSCRSPTPTRRGPPHTPSPGVAASSPFRLIPSQTDANTEYTTSDWLSYRARRPPYSKHPLSIARPHILNVVLRVAWARRRCAIIASLSLNDEPQCLVSPCTASVRLRQL